MNDVVVSRYQYYGYDSDRSSVQRVVISSWREKRVIVCIVLYAGERSRQSQTMYSELAVGSEVAWWPQTPPIGNLLVGWDGIIVSFSSWQNSVKILVEREARVSFLVG